MIEQFEFAEAARHWIHLVWGVPLVVVVSLWGLALRRRTLETFGYDRERSSAWLSSLRRRRWLRVMSLAAALVCLSVAAVQPRCNPERTTFKTSARDIAVVLDVSRSMLADDLQPNRLERAKLELSRLADHLKGDRIGLVVFAGKPVIQCPLTSNYSYFKRTLRNVSTTSVQDAGTLIGDAVRTALTNLLGIDLGESRTDQDESAVGRTVLEREDEQKPTFSDVILITDGEDHGSYPIHAAQSAAKAAVGIFAIGLGSESGTPIPVRDDKGNLTQLRDRDGNVVLSKLDSKTIQEMVNTTPRGRYLRVRTDNFDLVDFFEGTLGAEEGREVFEEQVFWTEIFQPFLFAGIMLYVLHLLLPERPRLGQLRAETETAKAGGAA